MARKFLLATVLLILVALSLIWPVRSYLMREDYNPIQKVKRKAFSLAAIQKGNLLPISAPIVINSIGLANTAGPYDEIGQPVPWVELYNQSSRPFPLSGYYLGDPTKKSNNFALPDLVIPPKKSLLLLTDGQATIEPAEYLPVLHYSGWRGVKDWFGSAKAFSLHATNNPALNQKKVPYFVMPKEIAKEADYLLWLRYKTDQQGHIVLQCRVDDLPPQRITLKPRKEYTIASLPNTHSPSKSWHLAAGKHSFCIELISGDVDISDVALLATDTPLAETYIHTDIKLSKKGGTIAVFTPKGMPLDYVHYPKLTEGQSYSRTPAGKGSFTLTNAIPARLSSAPPQPLFTSSFVSNPLTIRPPSSAPGKTIHVSFDGTIPTKVSPKLRAEITITNNLVLRWRSLAITNAPPSKTGTSVFWFGERPKIPILWLVTDPANLFDQQAGILANVLHRGRNSERPCHATLLFPDGRIQESDLNIRIQGRALRTYNCHRAFRFICHAYHDNATWPGQMFSTPGPSNLSTFIARPYTIFYPFGIEITRAIGLISPRYEVCLLYMNNQPFGLYILMDDESDPEYLRQKFGHLDFDVIKHKGVGDPVLMGKIHSHKDTWEKYAALPPEQITTNVVAGFIDLKELIHWTIAVQYLTLGDNDQGWLAFDKHQHQWKFLVWDLDGATHFFNQGLTNNFIPVEGFRGYIHSALMRDQGYARQYFEEFQRLLDHELQPNIWQAFLAQHKNMVMPYLHYEATSFTNQGLQPDDMSQITVSNVLQKHLGYYAEVERYITVNHTNMYRLLEKEKDAVHFPK